jgi:hypothetical protein
MRDEIEKYHEGTSSEPLDAIALSYGLTPAELRAYFAAIMREERIKCPQKAIQLDSLIGRDA